MVQPALMFNVPAQKVIITSGIKQMAKKPAHVTSELTI